MKKLVFILSLCAGAAFAQSSSGTTIEANKTRARTETWTVANSLATNVAALTSTSGMTLERGGAVAVTLSAESTRTITGGNLRCYVYMPVLEDGSTITYRWLAYSALDFTPATGGRDAASGDKQALTGVGRIIWVPDAITVSGGTTVVTTLAVRRGLPQ